MEEFKDMSFGTVLSFIMITMIIGNEILVFSSEIQISFPLFNLKVGIDNSSFVLFEKNCRK